MGFNKWARPKLSFATVVLWLIASCVAKRMPLYSPLPTVNGMIHCKDNQRRMEAL